MNPKRLPTIFFSAFCLLSLFQPASVYSEDTDPNKAIEPVIKYIRSIDGAASGKTFTEVDDIFVDNQHEELFVLDTGGRRVVISDLDGTFLHKFSFVDAGVQQRPVDLAVAGDGRIYIATDSRVLVTNYRGIYSHDLDLSTVPDQDKVVIQSIAVDGDILYIGDMGAKRVLVMDRVKEVFINQFTEGLGMNLFLALDDEGLYIRDPVTFSIYHLDKEGTPVGRFGKVSGLAGGFSMTVDIAMDRTHGRVIVLDANRLAVIFFDREGVFLYEFGGPRIFRFPRAVAADAHGRIYVYDATRKIRVFEVLDEASARRLSAP